MKRDQVPARLRVKKSYHVIVADDSQFGICATCILFQNQGTTRVILDSQIVVDPGETYEVNESTGRILTIEFNVKFAVIASPPTVDEPRIYSGNRLLTMILEPEILPT